MSVWAWLFNCDQALYTIILGEQGMHDKAALFYKQNGYYIAPNLIGEQLQDIAGILLEIDTIVVQQLRRLDSSLALELSSEKPIVHRHLAQLLLLDKEAYIASLTLCTNLFSVMSLLMTKKIVNLTQSFGIQLPSLQSHPVLHVMASDLKIPGGYHGIGTHQDWASLQGSLDTIIVWIPFMDVNAVNFPVEFIPGSHLGGLYPGKISEHLYEIDPTFYNETDFIPSNMSFGDVLFMSSFLLHRTRLINSTDLRIACTIRYENASENTYIDRVYPHAQKRSVNRELIYPGFPKAEQVRAVFKCDAD